MISQISELFAISSSVGDIGSCCLFQELKSLAKRSRPANDSNGKPQRSGDSDSDLDSSEGSDDEVIYGRIL